MFPRINRSCATWTGGWTTGSRSERSISDPERSILTSDEAFEVIVDDGFGDGGKLSLASRMEEDGVSSQAFGHPGDGGLGTVSRAGDLAMSRARDKS